MLFTRPEKNKLSIENQMHHTVPDWPTAKKMLLPRGIVVPVHGALWLYRRVPLSPVRDARTDEEALGVGVPLSNALQELAAATNTTLKIRTAARASYREVHLLLVNLTRRYSPPPKSRHAEQLQAWYGERLTQQRMLLFGVKLRDEVGGVDRSLRDVIESAAMSLATAEVPLSDYERDIQEVDEVLARCGFETPDVADFELAESWWDAGGSPETPVVNHPNHIHFFRSTAGAQMAARAGAGDCRQWPSEIPGHHTIAMGSVHSFDFQFESNRNARTQWASSLLDMGADAISIRGKLEPSYITRSELRRQRRRYIEDINSRSAQGRMSDQEQSEMLATLESVEGAYSSGKASPTMVETSVLAAFSGRGSENLETIANGRPFKVSPMSFRQNTALPETWIGSPVRSNPNVMDLPTTTIAFSGLPNLSTVGDRAGAQIGFTLHDRQSALFSATASADEDSTPIAVVCGSAGSGKDLELSTRIPTPTGWTTMGRVAVGDEVLGRDGRPVTVSWKSPVFVKDDLYRLRLSDGQECISGFDHQWVVSTAKDRSRPNREAAQEEYRRAHEIADRLDELASDVSPGIIASAEQIADRIRRAIPQSPYRSADDLVASLKMMDLVSESIASGDVQVCEQDALCALATRIRQQYAVPPRGDVTERRMTTGEMLSRGLTCEDGSPRFAIALPAPLDLPERKVPLQPYMLGMWLGSSEGTDMSASGVPGDLEASQISEVSEGRIPAVYLRSSFDQRLELLAGMMDATGEIGEEGVCTMRLHREGLLEDAAELARSLGIRTLVDAREGGGQLSFTTTLTVTRIESRACNLPAPGTDLEPWLHIESIEKIGGGHSACISVASPDRTFLAGGMVPTSNTQLMAFSGFQFALEGRPVIIVDPKKGSDLSIAFKGHVNTFSLDSFADASGGEGGTGIFDPLRFSKTPQDGINTAVSMLHFADIWQRGGVQNFEADLKIALKHGIAKGARAIGTALQIAQRDGVATAELAEPIIRQSRTDPLFGACVGLSDEGHVLSASEGITYIKVGNADLELPSMGANQKDLSLSARISVSLIRMMVFGSAEALRGRRGVLMLDEAWVFLGAGAEEVERLGRLARSLEVLPVLYTQRVTDIIEAKLQNHISRGVILHLRDPMEARAAFEIFGVDPTSERMAMTTNTERRGETGIQYNTRKPIFEINRDGTRGQLLRGSVGLYCDLRSRAVDTEIAIPQSFLELSSTNALDRARREGREVH